VLIYNKKHTEKKLKELSTSDKAEITEITKIVAQWGYALGITVVAQDLVTLNNFIRENFPNLNIFDLKVCVKLVSVDSDLLETDAEHYGKLTLIYVSKVLKAYERYKSGICFEVGQKVSKFQESNKPPMSKEERLKNFKELLLYAKKSVEQREVYFDTGESIYNFIRHNKLVNIDKDLIKKAMDSGEKEFRVAVSDSKVGNLKKMINDVDFNNTKKEDLIKRGARRFVVNFWLEKMNLDDILKKLTYEMLLY
jgi:hypothetical protein